MQDVKRYPDPAVQVLERSFEKYRIALATVERIAGGCRWAEGPVWFGDGRFLLWSDIPNDRILRWDEETGSVSNFRKPSNHANGNTRDRQGRLLTCEHSGRRVTRTEYDGTITVLADRYEGKKLNSPNDIVVKSDGSIWFTDPAFGIQSNYLGRVSEQELPAQVYRIDGHTGRLSVVESDLKAPNGLAFSPDESILYIIDSGVQPRKILAYEVSAERLDNPRVIVDAGEGTPDGLRIDIDGNLWCGWGMGKPELDGVRVFAPTGEAIGHIALPERCANLCFGGVHRNRLLMVSSTSVYSLYVNTQGVPGG